MGVVSYPTLEHVAMEARPYPAHLLDGCRTGLVLFAAAFLGHNDAIHMAEAGLTCMCVDVDADRVAEMRELYPASWSFLVADAWEWAATARDEDLLWDVVSADTFTGSAMERSLRSLDLWCSLARKVVTATITPGAMYQVPGGWKAMHYQRATGVYWLVLERE